MALLDTRDGTRPESGILSDALLGRTAEIVHALLNEAEAAQQHGVDGCHTQHAGRLFSRERSLVMFSTNHRQTYRLLTQVVAPVRAVLTSMAGV